MKLRRKITVANKDHLCGLCGKLIKEGERYWYTYQPEPHMFMGNEHTNCEGEKRVSKETKCAAPHVAHEGS